jgi:hypothetical protein
LILCCQADTGLTLAIHPEIPMKNSYIYSFITTLLAAFMTGCATTDSTTAPQASGGQTILQQALAREATLSGSYAAAAEDGFFSATVAGSGRPTVQAHAGVYQVTVPVAADIPAECFVYHEPLDAASTLSKLIDEPLADMPKTQILKIDAGTFGEVPYLYQEKLYITGQNAAGVLKGIVMPFESTLLACLHDTAGYSETFLKMARSFAGSLVLRNTENENWRHEEILVWKLHDMNIGYTVNRAAPDEGGDIMSVVETALIIPRNAQQTMTHDEYNLTFEQPDGTLINGRYAEAENGQVKVSVSVDGNGRDGYRVSGNFQGKTIDAPLKAAAGVTGPYYQYRQMVRAANPASGQPRALVLDTYVPSANPLETIAMEANPTGVKVDGLPEYEMLFAGLKATGLVDDKGQASMLVKMGTLELQLSRVYINIQP